LKSFLSPSTSNAPSRDKTGHGWRRAAAEGAAGPLIANPFQWATFLGVPHLRDDVGLGSEPGETGPPAPGTPLSAPAAEALFPELYDELRRIAHRHLGAERTGHTLSTTALVHEAYVKLADQTRARFANRSHFLAVASQAMRRILVGYARKVKADKRGGRWHRLDFDSADIPVEERAEALVALDAAMERLAELNPRLSRVVECRFFGGMTEEEVAAALGVADRTVRRDWIKAKGWLMRELKGADAP
jgi:RNA polymerase sigma factor (TIGR02999 family)